MLVIGLAGGIASGKSLVADCFMHFGAALIDISVHVLSIFSLPNLIQLLISLGRYWKRK